MTSNGLALSAVQLGVLHRVVVIDWKDSPIYMANPVVESAFGSQRGRESCLSLPGRVLSVRRSTKLTLNYLADDNTTHHTVISDPLLAACCLHEIDHLNGVLLLDREIR